MAVGADSSARESSGQEPKKHHRFSEPPKFIPVAFVCANIGGLYLIYSCLHLYPMMQFGVPSQLQDHDKRNRGIIEFAAFQYITIMLVFCYVTSILTHPGEIPDKDQDPYWELVPQDSRAGAGGPGGAGGPPNLQESKRSGERRYCKWCAKYKPDRCHHCRVCRTCILKMDHHCPWIYNCVGFRNHKFFFLLLLYSVLDTHLIMWSMIESVKAAVEVDTAFLTMFLLFFGETLAVFLGVLVTAFFGFHIWLMAKAMTTIEFCEKSLKKSGYNSSVYDHGFYGNVTTVLGPQPLLWLFPVSAPTGDGLNFVGEHSRLASKFVEPGRGGMRRVGHKKMGRNKAGRSTRGDAGGESGGGGLMSSV